MQQVNSGDIFTAARAMLARPLTPIERLDALLKDWGRWQKAGKAGGPRACRAGSIYGSGRITVWDDVESQVMIAKFEAIDTCLDDMEPMSGVAISDHYTGTTRYRWPVPFLEALKRGQWDMMNRLERKNIIL